MGTGLHGGFGNTNGNNSPDEVKLPQDPSQLDHIFGNREGHLPDTPGNRDALVNLANDNSNLWGKDKYGNNWNVKQTSDGGQLWVRHRNGVINEGGKNNPPRSWDGETGLNNNPFKGGKKK